METVSKDKQHIAIVGLGYVGLPLFCMFSTQYHCVGIDVDYKRVESLNSLRGLHEGEDLHNLSIALQDSIITSCWDDIKDCSIIIVTVPTPIDSHNSPDLASLKSACVSIAKYLKKGDTVIFESTVSPGTTDDVCVPLLEEYSGLSLSKDFQVGYSPERINVSDKEHSINQTSKIISSNSEAGLNIIKQLYESVLDAPVVVAASIKVAEAAKMYENVQRDVLIGLANEYAEYCRVEGIDIMEVTKCASTKWNFANVTPGLVGGHCISVDPYYLMERAKTLGLSLPIVRMARDTNEKKPHIINIRICQLLENSGIDKSRAKILLLGFSYKPNTSDIRNSKIADILHGLNKEIETVDCYDPLVDRNAVEGEYRLKLVGEDCLSKLSEYDLIIVTVNHNIFKPIIDTVPVVNLSTLL